MTKQFLLIQSPICEFCRSEHVINPNQFIFSDIKHILPCQMHVSAPIFHLEIVMKTITIVKMFAERCLRWFREKLQYHAARNSFF